MSHLIAYLGNEPENLSCALFSARNALYARDPRGVDGWAVGFIQGGDVLLQKRPKAEAAEVDLYALVRELKADAMIARVGFGHQGNVSAENADPFRFRSWLFGSVGSLPGFEGFRDKLLHAVPDFLRRNIRGTSASEHLFHLFLAYLHDAGLLDVASPGPAEIKIALEGTLSFVRRLIAGESSPENAAGLELALVTTNGRSLVATALSHPLQYLRVEGISDCPVCRNKVPHVENGRRISHDALRAVILEARDNGQGHPGWRSVADHEALVIGADRIPQVSRLSLS
ncbi:MAG TPA: class II glutamine amidotransferase [Polyangia bacterium]|jgi:glutamine amidotransferase